MECCWRPVVPIRCRFPPVSSSARRQLLSACQIVVTLAGLAACAPPEGREPAAHDLSTFEYDRCVVPSTDGRVRCGTLTTPENWAVPTGRLVRMPVMIFKSRDSSEARKPDPVLFLTGGPGVSPLGNATFFASLPMRDTRDIIVLEPRGYAHAIPALLCDGVDSLPSCFRKARADSIDLEQFTTENSARDLEALREQLNIDQWNVFGVSYGVFWALHNTRMYGAHVRSMVLDSPYPPQAKLDGPNDALNAFSTLFAACEVDTACNSANPKLKENLVDAVVSLNKSPATVNGTVIDGYRAFDAVYGALYDSETLADVPALISAIARRDYAALMAAPGARGAGSMARDSSRAIGLHASVWCADDFPYQQTKDAVPLREEWPDEFIAAARTEGWDDSQRCKSWPVKPAGAVMKQPVTSAVPSLILVGAFDPATPPRLATVTASTLSHSTILTVPTSHRVSITGNACILSRMMAFIENPMKPLDTSCVATIPAPEWRRQSAAPMDSSAAVVPAKK
jgi:pimeloyl-ACP methyl ester carboxylesterase